MDSNASEQPLTPAEMMRLAEQTERQADRAFVPDRRLMYVAWGVAYIVGFTAMWMADRPDPLLPTPVAVFIFIASLVTAGVINGWTVSTAARGVFGPEAEYGQRWAITFGVSFAGYGLIMVGLGRAFDLLGDGVRGDLMDLIAPVLAVFTVGVNYLNGGTHWRSSLMYPLGVALVIIAGVGAIVGTPNHSLVLGLGGGACFLVAAAMLGSRRGYATVQLTS